MLYAYICKQPIREGGVKEKILTGVYIVNFDHRNAYNPYTVCPRNNDPFYVVNYYIK